MINSVRQILGDPKHRLPTVEWDASLDETEVRMAALGVSDLVVMSMGTPIGTIAEAELCKSRCMSLDSERCRVSEVMSLKLTRISASTTIEEAMAISLDAQTRLLAIVDGSRFVGVISAGDLLTWLMRNQAALIRNFVAFAAGGTKKEERAMPSSVQESSHREPLRETWLAPIARTGRTTEQDGTERPGA